MMMNSIEGTRGRHWARIASLAAGTGCLGAWFGLALTGANVAASGACTAPAAPASLGIVLNINTSGGCDGPGVADYPITGFVAANVGTANLTVDVPVAFEGLSAHKFYWGTTTVAFVCTTGSGTGSTYSVTENTGAFPSPIPTMVGTLPTLTGDGSGQVVCAYTLTVQNAPTVSGVGSDKLNSSKVEMWLVDSGNTLTQAATESVDPPTLPTSTPTATATATATPTPTPTPITGVQGITTTPTPASGVQGIVIVPNTGAGGGGGSGSLALLVSGLALLGAGGLLGRRRPAA